MAAGDKHHRSCRCQQYKDIKLLTVLLAALQIVVGKQQYKCRRTEQNRHVEKGIGIKDD